MTRGMFRICTVVIWISLLGSGGVSSEDGGEAGEATGTKQGGFYLPPNNRFPPQRRVPQFSRSPYFPQRFPFIPQPGRTQQRTQTGQSSQSNRNLVLVLYIFNLMERSRTAEAAQAAAAAQAEAAEAAAAKAAADAAAAAAAAEAALTTTMSTTTASTTIATTTVCPWGNWVTCTATCDGTQTRTRTCSGVTETETQKCNVPQVGYQTSGWYLSINCLEYFVVHDVEDFTDAVTGCGALSGSPILASTGIRDDAARADIMNGLYSPGQTTKFVYVGAKETTDPNFAWEDSQTTTISFWDNNEPNNAAHDCVTLTLGNANSARDVSCTSSHAYLCERTP